MMFLEMPVMNYEDVWQQQVKLVEKRHRGGLDQDMVLMLEHEPVFTFGRRGGSENLKVSEAFLKQAGIQTKWIERGGNITYHGPGQLILYPIIDLRKMRLSVSEYVEKLEYLMIKIAAKWDVISSRDSRNRGIWVGNNKLGSVGIAVRHGITFHGLSFNVNLSLEPFDWINPCGLQDVGITSLKKETGRDISMADVRKSAIRYFETIFARKLNPVDFQTLNKMVSG
ncbi:MAG: lipoyl(octanoyl) transferase LipB [Desulfobacterales bacterium]|nr:lipoyl(octanoyl) transferase LipB [Desulfobacterales bacterium]